MVRTVLFGVVFCITCLTLAAAPKGAINGIVVDKESGIALPGATVQIIGTKQGTYAQSNGTFTLLNVEAGEIQLRISSIGYNVDTVNVTVGNSTPYTRVTLVAHSGLNGKEIVVIGEGEKGQARAFAQQKANANITNIVSSDQIGRFPDQNIGDAMKRIPGIAVQNDQGEARFGLIRGTPGQYNSVTLNGERIPSAEAEQRQVQLDLVPADMIRAIEVNKTLTPDMDADAIGGSVNLLTRDAATGQRLMVTAGSGYNMLSAQPMLNGSVIASTRLMDDKLGVVVNGSYFNHILGSNNIEATWAEGDSTVFLEEFEIRDYEIQRVRSSISAGLDYRFDADNTIRLSGIYNSRNDLENRFATNFGFEEGSDETEIRRQVKGGSNANSGADGRRLEEQRTYNLTLSGEHTIADVIKLTWNGTMARASEEKPYERYVQFRNRNATTSVNIANPEKPLVDILTGGDLQDYGFHELSEEYGKTEDVDRNGRVDVKFNWLTGDFANHIKVGGRVRTKTKNRANNFFEIEPTDNNTSFESMATQQLVDKTDNNFLAGPYKVGSFVDNNALGNYNLNDTSLFSTTDVPEEYAAGNFSATENIYGGYVMVDQKFGEQLQAIVGVRIESTSNTYDGNQFDIEQETTSPVQSTSSYTNVLPGVTLKYLANAELILRAAWTNSLARPNYFDLVPYRIINTEDGELEEGNANLKPTTSMNFDVMAEYYMEPIGILSAGVFHKNLENFIFTYAQENYADPISGITFDRYSKPLNGATATITGIEAAFQRKLDFLPGILSGTSIYLNYTYSTSDVKGVQGRENEALPLTGNPNHTFNASLSYEWEGLNLRIATNYASGYIDELGDDAFSDRYYDSQLFLDANASYAITSKIRIYVDMNNLTNQPLRYYQGIPSRTAQAEYYSSRFQAGVKFDL